MTHAVADNILRELHRYLRLEPRRIGSRHTRCLTADTCLPTAPVHEIDPCEVRIGGRGPSITYWWNWLRLEKTCQHDVISLHWRQGVCHWARWRYHRKATRSNARKETLIRPRVTADSNEHVRSDKRRETFFLVYRGREGRQRATYHGSQVTDNKKLQQAWK